MQDLEQSTDLLSKSHDRLQANRCVVFSVYNTCLLLIEGHEVNALKIGLIGCGSIALSAHIPALLRLSPIAQLVSICDVRKNVAERTARSHGVSHWTDDYRELLDNPAIDAVIITTPEFLHAEQTIAAAKAGKHVLCEKPIATSLAEADAMIAATEQAGVHFMVAHSRRFTARYQAFREAIDSGILGDIILIRENERRPVLHHSALNLPVDHWQPESGAQGSWKDNARYSGGVARGHAIHEMDLFRWFAGAEARAVSAVSKIAAVGRDVPDAMSFHVEFENDVLAACDLYTHAPTTYPFFHELEIIGTEAIIRARDTDMVTFTRFDGNGAQFPAAYETLLHVNDAYFNEQKAFFETIRDDRPLPLDPASARAALEIALAADHAASTGTRVEIPFVHNAPGVSTQ